MNETKLPPGIIWKTNTIHVDIDTGLIITKHTFIKHYIKIKTNKNVKLNEHKTHGLITYTIECRRNPQQKIFN